MKGRKDNEWDQRVKVRKSWGPMKPVTKIKDSDKIYTRKKGMTELLADAEESEEDDYEG